MCINYLGTFITNGEYHFEEHVEVNHLGLRSGRGSGWRTTFHCCSSTASHLAAIWQLRSCPPSLRHVLSSFFQHVWPLSSPLSFKIKLHEERELEREEKKEAAVNRGRKRGRRERVS